MNEFSYFVPNVHFEQIPIKNLVSNQEYQRNLSRAHINRAAAHFDLYQINPVKVSRRDGINYVFNGQHTHNWLMMVFNIVLSYLPRILYRSTIQQDSLFHQAVPFVLLILDIVKY